MSRMKRFLQEFRHMFFVCTLKNRDCLGFVKVKGLESARHRSPGKSPFLRRFGSFR